jgi:hypothetical protein
MKGAMRNRTNRRRCAQGVPLDAKYIRRADRTLPAKTPQPKRARPGHPSKVFAARYPGRCAGCGEFIPEDTLVCYQFGQLVHDNCVMPQAGVDAWRAGVTEAQG